MTAIRRRTVFFLTTIVAGGVAGGCGTNGADEAISPSTVDGRPNILLITADDLGFSDVGAYGGEILTPNIDRLAASGFMFTNFHTNTTCSPTRSMLFSGADSHQAGFGAMIGFEATAEQLAAPGYERYLHPRVASLSELLQEAGYHTVMAGKWHMGGLGGMGTGPHGHGFDRSFSLLEGLADHHRHLGVFPRPQPARYEEDGQKVALPEDFFSSRTFADRIIDFIASRPRDGRPFFAFLSFTAPHYPLQASEDDIALYDGAYDRGYEAVRTGRVQRQRELGLVGEDWEIPPFHDFWPSWDELPDDMRAYEVRRMQTYAAMVTAMDRNVGRVLDSLEETGLLDNTVVFFMSDNGPDNSDPLGAPGLRELFEAAFSFAPEDIGKPGSFTVYGPGWAQVSATPWRLTKHFMTRGGIVVPLIVRNPHRVTPGSRSDALVTVMDILPTMLDLAETEHPGTRFRGREVLPLLGKSLTPAFTAPDIAIHEPDYVFGLEIFDRRMVQKGDWKIHWANEPWGKGDWELYNLHEDPTELTDLSQREPEKLAEMLTEWSAYMNRVGVVLNEGFANPAGATLTHYAPLDSP